jgi:acetyl-CoA carboxylase biotin carboxylase subunit
MPRKTRKGKGVQPKGGRSLVLLMANDLPRSRAYKTLENLNFEIIDYPAESPSDYEVEKVIEFAKQKRVNLLLPMWSPHSEDHNLSLLCEKEGILFVGPQWKALKVAGNKQLSCKIAETIGLPVLPGGPAENAQDAAKIADRIGYPLVIKADEGGGGWAMDVVRSCEDLPLSWEKVRNKSSMYFPGSCVSIQKFVEKAAHLEVQIAGDKNGNVVNLGMRNCSYQLNRQKRIEESHGVIDNEKRKRICDLAVLFGKHLSVNMGHIILGTVEFIVDKDGNAYFIEMNGRIQVEHRVTEQAVGHGLDLVKLQIALATGESLSDIFPGGQEEIDARLGEGRWAVNARIYAESFDAYEDSFGVFGEVSVPPNTEGVHIDTPVYSNFKMSSEFSAHIMNVTACGKGNNARQDAIDLLIKTLEEIKIAGVSTNISKQIKALTHPDFISGHYDTKLYEEAVRDDAPDRYRRNIQRGASPSAWRSDHLIRPWPQRPRK